MFYRDTDIEELMTDALVHGVDESNQATFKYRMGYFLKSHPLANTSEAETINDNSLETKHVHEGAHGTLPESVLIHPSVGYSFRYGNVLLSGLDNSMEVPTVNNGTWQP